MDVCSPISDEIRPTGCFMVSSSAEYDFQVDNFFSISQVLEDHLALKDSPKVCFALRVKGLLAQVFQIHLNIGMYLNHKS